MGRWIYQKPVKLAAGIVQGILAGIVAVCLLSMVEFYQEGFTLKELDEPFEQTRSFMQEASAEISGQIAGRAEYRPFTTDAGAWDDDLLMDIVSGKVSPYGDELPEGTTYLVSDLRAFSENGDCQQLSDFLEYQMINTPDALSKEELAVQLKARETILPLSGQTLTEYMENPQTGEQFYDAELCWWLVDRSQQVERAWQRYQECGAGESLPGNLRYFVREQVSGEYYTNMESRQYKKAVEELRREMEENENLLLIFAGKRSGSVMVPETEAGEFSRSARKYFEHYIFSGSNEEVLIACDIAYPVSDSIKQLKESMEEQRPQTLSAMVGGGIALLLLLAGFMYSSAVTGRTAKGSALQLRPMDLRVHTEPAALLYCLLGGLWLLVAGDILMKMAREFDTVPVLMLSVTVEYWIFLAGFLSLLRRIKGKLLWKNSICAAVARTSRRVASAKQTVSRLTLAYCLVALSNCFLGYSLRRSVSAGVLMIILNGSILLYLLRDMLGRKSVKEGIRRIAAGNLEYKIDVETLRGDNREMGEAVNEMGTGLQTAVSAMVKNERLKAALITNVSHDIKTPLTSIINYVDLLRRENLDNEKANGYLDVLEKKSWRLKQLTEDLVEASKISSGCVELELEPIGIVQALKQAVGEFEEVLEEQKLEVILETGEEQPIIEADGRQLWRVFENLLQNIKKYALPGTRVYILMRTAEEKVTVSFKNISAQRLNIQPEELTERFVRGDLSRGGEGSGLGLSIAKSLTELMKGQLEIYLDGDLFNVSVTFPTRVN